MGGWKGWWWVVFLGPVVVVVVAVRAVVRAVVRVGVGPVSSAVEGGTAGPECQRR